MSISELDSLGELVSSIAVVVTLLFLGLQVRQSNILARRNQLNMGHSQISQLRIAVASMLTLLIGSRAAYQPARWGPADGASASEHLLASGIAQRFGNHRPVSDLHQFLYSS